MRTDRSGPAGRRTVQVFLSVWVSGNYAALGNAVNFAIPVTFEIAEAAEAAAGIAPVVAAPAAGEVKFVRRLVGRLSESLPELLHGCPPGVG